MCLQFVDYYVNVLCEVTCVCMGKIINCFALFDTKPYSSQYYLMLDCLTEPPCITRVGISNYIPQYSVGCNYLSLPEIPASGSKVLIRWYDVSFSVSDLLDIRWPVLAMYSKYVSDIQLEHLPKKNVIVSTLCRNRADLQPLVRLGPNSSMYRCRSYQIVQKRRQKINAIGANISGNNHWFIYLCLVSKAVQRVIKYQYVQTCSTCIFSVVIIRLWNDSNVFSSTCVCLSFVDDPIVITCHTMPTICSMWHHRCCPR